MSVALGFTRGCTEITQRANGRAAVHPEYFRVALRKCPLPLNEWVFQRAAKSLSHGDVLCRLLSLFLFSIAVISLEDG